MASDNSKAMRLDLPPPAFPQGPSLGDSALDTPTPSGTPFDSPAHHDSRLPRVSFSAQKHAHRFKSLMFDEEAGSIMSERPPIPSALPITSNTDATPLPKIPMIVLCIAVLGEFLSANVSTPFIVDMVKGFDLGDESELGEYTGMIVSAFFVTQFLTSLLWATVANKHGNRAVLFVALLGNAITCVIFGTCTSFPQAVTVRLIQGVFNGAVGVARSSIVAVTDPSNESRAYGIMGFSWGLGGVAGAIIGGAFETPTKRWPTTFGRVPLFQEFPYLLPTLIAGFILLIGAILSLFLAWDGGPREGAIRLTPEKDEEPEPTPINLGDETVPSESAAPAGPLNQLRQSVNKKVSGYFATRVRDAHVHESPGSPNNGSFVHNPTGRAFSRTSRANGSAYGYRSRLGSRTTFSSAVRRPSVASTVRNRAEQREQDNEPTEDLNFAQKLVIANEFNTSNLTSLWVTAAINVDNEDPFDESDDELSSDDEAGPSGLRNAASPSGSPRPPRRRLTSGAASRRMSAFTRPGSRRTSFSPFFTRNHEMVQGGESGMQSMSHILLPAIYANPGVNTPPALLETSSNVVSPNPPTAGDPFVSDNLAPIMEGQIAADETENVNEKVEGFKWSYLPLFLIFQYFILALHTTSHDQVFLMYLTSLYDDGGLGLDPGHFAQLIALMCIAQVIYQFYLYPNIGPPRGKFSHLAMFRIGSALFIPAYLTVTLYRVFASPTDDGNPLIMALLALSTAVRYAGTTFAFTSIAVLLNYMSPPHMVSFSNGLAQSLASLARIVGPLLGGGLWSASVAHHPGGYPFGFYAVSLMCAVAICLSFFIR